MTAMTPEQWSRRIGQHVADRRRAAGIRSIRQAAERAGVAEATWRFIENGRSPHGLPAPNEQTRYAMASALGWPKDWLEQLKKGRSADLAGLELPPAPVGDVAPTMADLEGRLVGILEALNDQRELLVRLAQVIERLAKLDVEDVDGG